jgi:hypothetical protein
VGICLLTSQDSAEKTAFTGSFLKRKILECQYLKEEIDALSREVGQLSSTNLGVPSFSGGAELSKLSNKGEVGN